MTTVTPAEELPCDECGQPAMVVSETSGTTLCRAHFEERNRRIDARAAAQEGASQ